MNDTEPDAAQVRTALATLVATEPELPAGTADIERRGRRRLVGRYWGGLAAAVLVVTVASLGASSLRGPAAPVAAVPDDTSPIGGSQLAMGFPLGSATAAVQAALPAGVSLGELPMDLAFQPGGQLDLPVNTPAGPATLTVRIDQGRCDASVLPLESMTWSELAAIAASVCSEWIATGSLPVVPGDPSGVERPDLAAQ